MQTTTDMMMAAWRQTGGALPTTSPVAGSDEPLATGPLTNANGRICFDIEASVTSGAVTYRMPGCAAENYIDIDASVAASSSSYRGPLCWNIDADASVSAAAVTFRVPGCVAEDCIDVDASVSAATISWHGGVCRPAGAA